MASARERTAPVGRWNFKLNYLQRFGFSERYSGITDTSSSSSSIEFDFLEVGDGKSYLHETSISSSDENYQQHEVWDEYAETALRDTSSDVEESKKFWETQHQLLQATLRRSSSVEAKLRNLTKEALEEIQMAGNGTCDCGAHRRPTGCRNCLMREVSVRLHSAGFDCGVCKCRWRSSPSTSAGEHAYLDVLYKSRSKNGEVVRVIINLDFRAEFEVARASDEYLRLLQKLPEVFVGKAERLQSVIKILCRAAKKCMHEKQMHIGPWRKHGYMQAKWFSPNCERSANPPTGNSSWLVEFYSTRSARPRASMLTVDMLETLPNSHANAVQVA
ncbi:uncharacterized protein LOC116202590 [Punica granatum]|uniref:Uncharacterized protein LOC116202590 n=1 Tax=Punica granatum TaxID=22663 RepID=A0A218Y2D7_PUNGR|nr:uncharacterized protein LOC116202590 [Punica granatum]OWM91228.1 hypothetical protein CDL15_Pgr000172 [Punica granatum]